MLGSLREDELRCMGAIHILALNKNSKGEICPISIPSIWRKLLSSMIVTFRQEAATTYLGPRQHGIGMPSGISRFAKKVADLAVARPDLLFLQTDISNAFGMVHRESVQQVRLQCDESLAACSRAWLSREATGFVQLPGQQRQRITSARGLQQGDPLSALAFSIVSWVDTFCSPTKVQERENVGIGKRWDHSPGTKKLTQPDGHASRSACASIHAHGLAIEPQGLLTSASELPLPCCEFALE
eukprot:4452110-Amphidinium_carterae.1